MNVETYMDRTRTAAGRSRDYRELVKEYYEGVTIFYQHGWGDCFHFAPFLGQESLKTSLVQQQSMLIRDAGITAEMTVLDLGCGIGGPARQIARMTDARVTGITISPTQVETARKITSREGLDARCNFELGDAVTLDLQEEHFDVVYMTESLCHMPQKDQVLRGCQRVLKPGGVLAGWDWIEAPGLDDARRARFIEPICQYFALPELASLAQIGAWLEELDLRLEHLEDLGDYGNPAHRWWAPLEQQVQSTASRVASYFSSTLKMMRRSGELLVEGGQAGAFSPLGYFVARKI